MKHSAKNTQEEKFERKLNHLQGFIGMPNWNFESPTFDEIKEHDRRGRELQAKAIHSTTKRIKDFMVKLVKKVTSKGEKLDQCTD